LHAGIGKGSFAILQPVTRISTEDLSFYILGAGIARDGEKILE
jgi:hypothetical protein